MTFADDLEPPHHDSLEAEEIPEIDSPLDE